MRIQHNIPSMNAYRNYNNNASALNRNLEKLSSGYRINRAGDDAAGLAISEKMRAQITGLDAATKNVKDGISLVKTAEGAMQEVHDMLGRMKYLATQSSNGTYQDDVDRENIQKEVNSLLDEINRIADSANFNGQKLLNGELDNVGRGNAITLPGVGPTAGTDTRLHEAKKEAVKGSYTVNFNDVKFEGRPTGGSSAPTGSLSVSLGNGVSVNVSIAASASATWADDLDLGKIIANVFANTTNTDGTMSGSGITATVTGARYISGTNGTLTSGWYLGSGTSTTDMDANKGFSVTSSGNKVTIQQVYEGTNTTDFKVNNEISVSGSGGFNVAPTMTYNQKSVNATATVVKTNGQSASTVIDLTTDQMVVGNGLKFGADTYTFVDGKGTGPAVDPTKKTIRIDDLLETLKRDPTQKDAVLTEFADRVSQVAKDNKAWDVSTVAGTPGKIMLVEQPDASAIDKTTQKPTWDFSNEQAIKDSINYVTAGKGLSLQIGDTSDNYNQMKVGVTDMHAKTLGIAGLDVSTADAAHTAIDKIQNAINSVSSTRGDLGAIQNRLEHTSNNLSVMKENIQDAESTIRDTDVADEMMKYTKNNILLQSAQAMLAQANQLPQGVLQLLQ